MELPFIVATMARRGLLDPGNPVRVVAQLAALHRWGFGLAGELRQAAARQPDRIAVIDADGHETSYRELLGRAERLSVALRSRLGIAPGDRIGVLCRNHSGLIEALVAGALVGADTVLVNTGLSAGQLATVATDQRLRLLVHDVDFADLLGELPSEVERLDEQQATRLVEAAPDPAGSGRAPQLSGGSRPSAGWLRRSAGGSRPSAGWLRRSAGRLRPPEREGRTIVLTSGTTGAPKGARRPVPAGFGPLVSIIDRIPIRAGDRIMIAAPVFHTWGYAALQLAFAMRATVVLHRRFDPATVRDALVRHRCTGLFAVPVMLQRLLEVPPPDALPPLRVVAVSGSALPGALATRFMDAYGDVLYNLYGSTEVSWASIATPADLRRDPATAGRPPHGTRLAILGSDCRPVPTGQVGRIFVGNEMLFDGYTSGAGRERQNGLLSTGDLGRLDADGLLFVEGREDDMIVSGGENVFPAEVENLLARLPQVREVAVVGVPDEQYGQRLAAYVVPRPGATLDPEEVRAHVRAQLARFCVPRDVVFLDRLPRNATGKVVVRELTKDD